jgi:thermolabile hemolysin
MRKVKFLLLSISVSLFSLISSVSALANTAPQEIQRIVVFGDSLSDNGNYYRDSEKDGNPLPPSPPYAKGRASNGYVWPEYLAKFLKANLDDQAYLGALTVGANDEYKYAVDLKTQVDNYIKAHDGKLDGDHTLYVFWGGANNIFVVGQNPDKQYRVPFIDMAQAVFLLKEKGGRYFVVPGLPNLANIPLTNGGPGKQIQAVLGILSMSYNAENSQMVNLLNAQDPQNPKGIVWSDINGLFQDIQTNPGKYNFQNVTAACYNGLPNIDPSKLPPPCATPNAYLFWDLVHPTTKGQCFLAHKIHEDIANQGWTTQPPQEEFDYCHNMQSKK